MIVIILHQPKNKCIITYYLKMMMMMMMMMRDDDEYSKVRPLATSPSSHVGNADLCQAKGHHDEPLMYFEQASHDTAFEAVCIGKASALLCGQYFVFGETHI